MHSPVSQTSQRTDANEPSLYRVSPAVANFIKESLQGLSIGCDKGSLASDKPAKTKKPRVSPPAVF